MLNRYISGLMLLLASIGLHAEAPTNHAEAPKAPRYTSDKLIPVADLGKKRAIGVSVSSDNRLFVSFPNRPTNYQYGLVEIINGKTKVYPDAAWNETAGDQNKRFVSVQDLYVDIKDNLWVLDSKPSGGSIFGKSTDQKPEGYFKLLKINLKTNQVEKVYHFDDLNKVNSGLNDVRVDTDKNLAYLSDPGQSAIVVLDLTSGKTRTLLQKHPATQADPNIVLSYDGKEMRNKEGTPFRSNINGIALTKDNKYFYFKPINKLNLYRIETRNLADASLSDKDLGNKVEDLGKTAVTHGLEADKKGNIYLTSSLDYSIKYFSPDGKLHTLVQDSRLLWPDSLGIGNDGYLYLSCAQLQRDPQWNGGEDHTEYPYTIFKVKLPE